MKCHVKQLVNKQVDTLSITRKKLSVA